MRYSLTIPFLIIISLLTCRNTPVLKDQNVNDYEKNLNSASKFYLSKTKIPEKILLGLTPKDYTEFGLYYETTSPDHILSESGFFYATTRMIFEQVTSQKNENFYSAEFKADKFRRRRIC